MKVMRLSQAAVAMKPGSNVYTPWSRVRLAMFSTSGPSVPLLPSTVAFLPFARLVSSNFFSAMSGSSVGRAELHERAASIKPRAGTRPEGRCGLFDDLDELAGLRLFVRVQIVQQAQLLFRVLRQRRLLRQVRDARVLGGADDLDLVRLGLFELVLLQPPERLDRRHEQRIGRRRARRALARAGEYVCEVVVIDHRITGRYDAEVRASRAHDRRVTLQAVHIHRLGLAGAVLREHTRQELARAGVRRRRLRLHLDDALLVGRHRDQAVGAVLYLPAAREHDRHAEIGVIEAVTFQRALCAARAHRQAFDRPQIFVALGIAGIDRALHLLRGRYDFVQTQVVVRVAREHAVIDARLALFLAGALDLDQLLVFQQAYDVDHVARRVAGLHQVLGAEPVRLQLLIAAVATDESSARVIRETRQVRAPREDADSRGADAGERRLALLSYRMTSAHVADLVPEHGFELGLVIEVIHDAASDVDVAATGREGVDLFAVQHGEGVLQLRTLADLRGALAYFVDVGLQLGIVVDAAELLQQHRVHFLGLLDLAGFALEYEVGRAGDGIGRTACKAGDGWEQQHQSGESLERHDGAPARLKVDANPSYERATRLEPRAAGRVHWQLHGTMKGPA